MLNNFLSMSEGLSPEALDFLEAVLRWRKDPVAFGNEALGFNFYPEQRLWLWASTHTQKEKVVNLWREMGFVPPHDYPSIEAFVEFQYANTGKSILCTANQIGKTFLTAIKHIWSNYFKISNVPIDPEVIDTVEYKTLNISPHSDQSDKCREYVQRMLRGEMVYFSPDIKKFVTNKLHPALEGFLIGGNDNLGELRFANGSYFYSKSSGQDKGTSRAGEQFGYISYDECAQSRHLAEEIPMLQSRLIRYGYCFDLISSPEAGKPSHQHYWRLVKKGKKLEDRWWSMTDVIFDNNIFISPEQKQKAIEDLESTDKQKAKQMLRGGFITLGARFFPMEAIAQMFDGRPRVLRQEAMTPGRKYIMAIDWGMADGGDKTWFFIIDYTDYLENRYYLVYHEVLQGGSPTMQMATARVIFEKFGGHGQTDAEGNITVHPVKLIMDTNAMGGVMLKKMLSDLKPIDFTSHGGEKDRMLEALKLALEFGREYVVDPKTGDIMEKNLDFGKLRSYFIPEVEEQFGVYQIDDQKLEQDTVMAIGMAIWYLEKKLPKKPGNRLDLNPNVNANRVTGNIL